MPVSENNTCGARNDASSPDACAPRKTAGTILFMQQWAFRTGQRDSRPVALARCWLRIFFIMLHEFFESEISLRASALTYSIVLSMVPLLALSTALLKGMGGGDQLKTAAYRFIEQIEPGYNPGADSEETGPATAPGGPAKETTDRNTPAAEAPGGAPPSLAGHLRNAVDTIFDYVEKTNFAAIGAFGIIGLLVAVVLLMSTIEDALNAIWHSRRSRSLLRKVMDYLALLILLPVSINIAIAGEAVLASPEIMARLHILVPSDWAVTMLLKLLPFLFVILTLMVMYMFFPTDRVSTGAAFIGALFGGIFWFLVQKGYILLQIGVSRYNAIYGSFATVPLFLVWVHLGWTFILLGAGLAYAVQNRNRYSLPGSRVSPQRALQIAFDILNTVYVHFAGKTPTSENDLIRANPGYQPGDIREITEQLLSGGLLHRTADPAISYLPAAPAETIEARQVVRLILGHDYTTTIGGHLSGMIIDAAEQAVPPDAFPALTREPAAGPEKSTDRENYEKTL